MASPRRLVAFDLETTGLHPGTDRIVEVGAVCFEGDGTEVDRFERLVNPGRPVPPAARRIHGLGDEELRHAATAAVVLPEFLAWLAAVDVTTLLAHNARFDAAFLSAELARIGHPWPDLAILDTLSLARRRLPQSRNHRLETLGRFLGLDTSGLHRALADSRIVMAVWLTLADDREPTGFRLHRPDRDIFPPPIGWEAISEAIAGRRIVRMRYEGGTSGDAPRDVTPLRFEFLGGTVYLVARCHRDSLEKRFRLERIRTWEIVNAGRLREDGVAYRVPTTPG